MAKKTKLKVAKKQTHSNVSESSSDFDNVAHVLDKFGVGEVEPLPEEYEEYLSIPLSHISELMPDELHMHMGCIVHQLGYLENLVANAEIEVRELERQFTETWHTGYEGQNKKMSAERKQLDSGIWDELDVARGILSRVQVERNRLDHAYKFFSRVLSSRQERL